MDFKALALASTLGGTVLLSGLTWSGAVNLQDIKNMGFGWGDKVVSSVNETKDMLNRFNLFKTDVTAQLNSKIAKINELNDKIADLMSQVGNGQVSLEDANNEIARLNEELEKANAEVQALKDEFGVKDAEIQEAYASMNTDADMDTTLTLDAQTETPNTDTSVDGGTTTPPTDSGTTTPSTMTAQEQAIYDEIVRNVPSASTDLTVDIVDNEVTINTTASGFTAQNSTVIEGWLNTALAPQTATYKSGVFTGTQVYTIN